MPFFYVAEPGYRVIVRERRIGLEREGKVEYEAPLAQCEALVAFGHVEVSRSAIDALLSNGRTILFLDSYGRRVGSLRPPEDRAVSLRVWQCASVAHFDTRLSIARRLAERKLRAMADVASQRLWHAPDPKAAEEVERIRLSVSDCPTAPSLEVLRGIEGSATRRYYRLLARCLLPPHEFHARVRRPPKDPFNALLSLGGVLLAHEAEVAIAATGLDPYVGFLHEAGRGRPALALDILEPLRSAVVDRWALELLNKRRLAPEQFAPRENGAVYLADPDARRLALRTWREAMGRPPMAGIGSPSATARKCLAAWAKQLASSLPRGS